MADPLAEDGPQTFHFRGIPGGGRSPMGIDTADVPGGDLCIIDGFMDCPDNGFLIGPGEMVGIRGPSDSRYLSLWLQTQGTGLLFCGKNQDTCSLGEDKTFAVKTEGA